MRVVIVDAGGANTGSVRYAFERLDIDAALVTDAASIRAATGFDYDEPAQLPVTADPDERELALLRGPVCDEMLETYPEFCARVFARKAAA